MQYIIMQDRHPIDERFRQGLGGASVTPPPSVWQGVQRSRGKRAAGWWWKAGAVLLLLGMAVATWSIVQPAEDAAKTTSAPAGRNALPVAAQRPDATAAVGGDSIPHAGADRHPPQQVQVTANGLPGGEASRPASEALVADRPASGAPDAGAHGGRPSAPGRTFRQGPPVSLSLAAADPLVMDLHPATPAREVLSAERLLLLPPRSTAGQGLPRSTRPEDYLLRPAEFWVAMEAGIFQQDLRAQAPNRLLAAEQDRSLSPATSSGFGLLVGRTWRNGTRLATGLAHHVEEHAFLYDTRRDSLSWDVQESVTVLDTLVIAQAIDSVANLHPLGGRTSGNTRFETWVVPVEAGWGTRRGRWSLELLSGLVWERRRWTGGPQLTSSGEGPGASVREAHAAAVEVRRTDVLGLRAGLMLGFWPAERLVLSAGPWHDRGITLLSNEGALHRRTGVRVRLAFLLQRPGR